MNLLNSEITSKANVSQSFRYDNQARNQGVRLVRTNPTRNHVGPFFFYVFRKLDCHNFFFIFKLHEI